MSDDPLQDCLVLNTVAAARALVRRYDAALKGDGVTVQQFALLGAIARHPGLNIGALAERLMLDRTTLTRTLALLERKGLVARQAAKGNARQPGLTPKGQAVLHAVMPKWRAAQSEIAARLGRAESQAYLTTVRNLIAD